MTVCGCLVSICYSMQDGSNLACQPALFVSPVWGAAGEGSLHVSIPCRVPSPGPTQCRAILPCRSVCSTVRLRTMRRCMQRWRACWPQRSLTSKVGGWVGGWVGTRASAYAP